jgi:hypothetical protein
MICERAFLGRRKSPARRCKVRHSRQAPETGDMGESSVRYMVSLRAGGVWPLAGYDEWHDAQETKREQAARAREDAGLARRSTTQMTRCSGAEKELSLSSLQPLQYPVLSRSLAQAVQTVGEFVGACENAIALPKSNWHPYLK